MTTVREHYDQHLGPVYTWMAGGFDSALERGSAEIANFEATPTDDMFAVDLGAGFGMHAIPLARRGYNVLAIDTCQTLLNELSDQSGHLPIQTIHDDLRSFSKHLVERPDLILCMGDTLAHLEDKTAVAELVSSVSSALDTGGRFLASLRDYSTALSAAQRFIPVHSDSQRILTCYLEYADEHVTVHDILHEWDGSTWALYVSAYKKLRLSLEWLTTLLLDNGFSVNRQPGFGGMVRLVATRV